MFQTKVGQTAWLHLIAIFTVFLHFLSNALSKKIHPSSASSMCLCSPSTLLNVVIAAIIQVVSLHFSFSQHFLYFPCIGVTILSACDERSSNEGFTRVLIFSPREVLQNVTSFYIPSWMESVSVRCSVLFSQTDSTHHTKKDGQRMRSCDFIKLVILLLADSLISSDPLI